MSSGIHRAVAGTHQRSRFRNSDNLSATDTTFSCLALGGGGSPFPLALPSSIERMRRIERIAVDANVGPIASVFEVRLQAVVARLAERAERTQDELVVIAVMRRVMIGDRRGRDAPLFLAQDAERGDLQLMLGACSPGLKRIPAAPGQALCGSEIARGHGVILQEPLPAL